MKEKLTLSGKPDNVAPLAGKPNGDPVEAKPRFNPATLIREFQMLDGRPLCLHKATVTFAVPLVSDPERATVVGVKGARACPVRISYADFLRWWLAR